MLIQASSMQKQSTGIQAECMSVLRREHTVSILRESMNILHTAIWLYKFDPQFT